MIFVSEKRKPLGEEECTVLKDMSCPRDTKFKRSLQVLLKHGGDSSLEIILMEISLVVMVDLTTSTL